MSDETTFDLNGHCPRCGYEFTAATPLTGMEAPKHGDFSVCIKCASILRYGRSLEMSLPSNENIKDLMVTDPAHFSALMQCQRLVIAQIRAKTNLN
jgi:hypothetical protein